MAHREALWVEADFYGLEGSIYLWLSPPSRFKVGDIVYVCPLVMRPTNPTQIQLHPVPRWETFVDAKHGLARFYRAGARAIGFYDVIEGFTLDGRARAVMENSKREEPVISLRLKGLRLKSLKPASSTSKKREAREITGALS